MTSTTKAIESVFNSLSSLFIFCHIVMKWSQC